jgi:hypothetical protein
MIRSVLVSMIDPFAEYELTVTLGDAENHVVQGGELTSKVARADCHQCWRRSGSSGRFRVLPEDE